jgi:hypothetical protein
MRLFRGVVVAVVGAGDQVGFAGVLDQVRNIFVGFASDKEAAIFEKIGPSLKPAPTPYL